MAKKKIVSSLSASVKAAARKVDPADIIRVPDVESMLGDAMTVIAVEVAKYKSKVNRGGSLDPKEARVLQGYIKALVDLSKENRERSKEDNLDGVSNADLIREMISSIPDGEEKRQLVKELMQSAVS